ncbi:MAG: hypothetical protein AAFZ92_10740 [Pseudomonadota bacterium]
MFKYIAIVLVSFFCSSSFALGVYEWTLDVNTSSWHSSPTYGRGNFYNEDNDGFGFSYGYSDMLDFKMGYFENSYHNTSVYAGLALNKDYYFYNDIVLSPGIGVMFTTGYKDTNLNAPTLAPIVHPSITIGHRMLRSTIGYIPYGENTVLTFQTQIQF